MPVPASVDNYTVPGGVKLYFDAHKDEFKDKKPKEVRSQIETELKK